MAKKAEVEINQGGFILSQIHHISKRVFNQILKEHEIQINPGQGRFLFVLWQEDGIPIQTLSRRLSLSTSTLTSMLDRMEKAKIVKRVSSDSDRRKILIKLTDETKDMYDKFMVVSLEMTDVFYKGFSQKEIDHFESYLTRIHKNLIEHEKKSKGT